MNEPRIDRRSEPRTAAFGVAVVISGDGTAQRYRVDNLSAGGALLTGEPALPEFEVLRLVLRVGAIPARTIEARVVWQTDGPVKGYGVTFVNLDAEIEDAIQDVVLGILGGAATTPANSRGRDIPSWLP